MLERMIRVFEVFGPANGDYGRGYGRGHGQRKEEDVHHRARRKEQEKSHGRDQYFHCCLQI